MEVLGFALGVRMWQAGDSQVNPETLCRALLHNLSAQNVVGLELHGGWIAPEAGDPESVYLFVLMNGKLKQMRTVNEKLDEDAEAAIYFTPRYPKLAHNRLLQMEELPLLGRFDEKGVWNSEAGFLPGLVMPQETAIKVRMEMPPRVLLVDNTEQHDLQQMEKFLTAVHQRMPRIRMLPIRTGEADLYDMALAAGGRPRTMSLALESKDKIAPQYMVMDGVTAVVDLAQIAQDGVICSENAARMIKRAFEDGLNRVVVGCGGLDFDDRGENFLRIWPKVKDWAENILWYANGGENSRYFFEQTLGLQVRSAAEIQMGVLRLMKVWDDLECVVIFGHSKKDQGLGDIIIQACKKRLTPYTELDGLADIDNKEKWIKMAAQAAGLHPMD